MSESRMPTKVESSVPQTREQERTIRPDVDIFETKDGLGVVVDMPGVKKEDVDIRVENDVLTITGRADSKLLGTPLYNEYQLGNYFRQFQLTDHVDQEKIRAEMKHGVLTIHLPKAEKAKPKKIEVRVK